MSPALSLNNRFVIRSKIFSHAVSVFLLVVGALVVAGWIFDLPWLKSVYGNLNMKANTAVALFLAGASLWTFNLDHNNTFARRAGLLCAAMVTLVGALTLSQYLFGWNLGIDELLFTEPAGVLGTTSPGRMGPPASICITLAGIALLLLHSRRAIRLAQLFSILVGLWALLAIIGYLYRAEELYLIAGYTAIGFHTSVSLFAMSLGLLAARIDSGLTAVISSDWAGGVMARRLLAVAAVVPFLLGFLCFYGQQSGYYDQAFGTALLTLALIIILTVTILQSAAKLNDTEQQQLAAEERFRLAVESAPHAMVMMDAEGRIVLANSQTERLFGYAREELMGLPVEELVPERFRSQHQKYRARFARMPQARPIGAGRVLFGLRKDGSEVPIEIALNPVEVEGQSLVLSSIVDITERKETEDALRESEQRFRTMADNLPLLIWVTNATGEIEFVNRTYREFFGVTEEEARGSNWQNLMYPDDADQYISAFLASLRERQPFRAQARVRRTDGEWRWVDSYGAPRFSAAGEFIGAVGSSPDITERKQIEAELTRADKLKDEFLATVSHELRTPLNAILGWVSMLRRSLLDEATVTRAMETIDRNALVQAQLIEDLLDISRIVSGKIRLDVKVIDLTAVCKEAMDSVQHAADAKGIRLQMVVDRACHIRGDAVRLQQVVWNLLANAVKFTPLGGRVRVGLDGDGSQAQITVSDTGEGINPDFLPYVFDRFQQADATTTRRHSGLGLGLAIVRHIVELHGGTVEAHSEGRGQGASFAVKLPIAEARAEGQLPGLRVAGTTGRESPILADSTLLSGLRVLAVDDEPDTREMVKTALEQHGAYVITAATARDLFEALPGFKPDVLLCDIGMPEEDGYSLIHRVRALPPEQGGSTPAVAFTGYVRVEERARALEAGYQMFIPKPVEADELALMIADLVGRKDKGMSAR